MVGAVRAGAKGYLSKNIQSSELRTAIKAISAGEVQLASRAAAHVMREVQSMSYPAQLTGRELQVMHLLVEGCSNKEIMQRLQIAEDTVKTHVRHILAKLEVRNRSQAIVTALHLGLVARDGGM